MELASVMKDERKKAGLSQEQAAEALGVSRQTVSNWETGRSYPDIVSVIKMSELYSVSLDRLLKEGTSVDPSYRDYLEQSTDTVKSNERKAKLILTFAVLGIWALCLAAFFLLKDRTDAPALSLGLSWAVLPVLFFAASFVVGAYGWFGKLKWLAAPLSGLLFAASGSVMTVAAEGALYRSVIWPDLGKLPAGLAVSLAGLLLGAALNRKKPPAAGRDRSRAACLRERAAREKDR